LSNEGIRPIEIYKGTKSQYGDSCSNQNKVFKRANRFKGRTTFLESGPGSGRPIAKEEARPANLETLETFAKGVTVYEVNKHRHWSSAFHLSLERD